MAVQITVIGLGQIGASFGLALAEHKDNVFRCGYDPVPARTRKLEKEGVFDKLFYNLPESIHKADVVILALPVDQIEDTLKYISEDLKSGVVVIDTSPVRAGIVDWAVKLLPAERHFISMMPVINAIYLDEKPEEYLTPHADLFINGEMVIATESSTHPDAVKLAADLALLVGSKAYFVDPLEADGISAKVELLPKLVSSALLISTLKQSGWKDIRRFTSKSFQKSTEAVELLDEKDHLGLSAILNRDNTLQALDTMIASLGELRAYIEAKDQERLERLLKSVADGRTEWAEQRKSSEWERSPGEKPPYTKGIFGRLFGVGTKAKNKK
ncbi:MAG: putative prephenate dehydrogenase [Chloroflexi bacterium]|nr:MAG: putative prephenate dehydrogenase [Chloroflexota bacterium]MBA4375137.1 hypothetical protein [Anaerolinea sp.]